MIKDFNRFNLTDQSNNRNNFSVEVNWNPNDEKTNECKVLKFRFSDGKEAFIKKEHLLGLLFIVASPDEQKKMVPQVITKVRHWMSTMYVQLKKDCKSGDILKVPVNITLPAVSEEIIGELRKDVLHGNMPRVEKDILPTANLTVPNFIQKVAKDYK